MATSTPYRRVFLSSTAEDLREHREKVYEGITRLNQQTIRMESFGARPNAPVAECCRQAGEADALVVIVAHRYGWVPTTEQGGDGQRSITRLEVDAARARHVPIFVFVVDDSYAWPLAKEQDRFTDANVRNDPARRDEVLFAIQALTDFKRWLGSDALLIRDTFTSPEDLATKVVASLAQHWLATPTEADGAALLRSRFITLLNRAFAYTKPMRLYVGSQQSSEPPSVSLASVYTALDVTLEIEPPSLDAEAMGGEEVPTTQSAESLPARLGRALAAELEYDARLARPTRNGRRARALEVAAVAQRLVIVGAPGGGKSTFVRHLAACMLGQLLGDPQVHVGCLRDRPAEIDAWMPWERRALLPIFVDLAHFTRSPAFGSTGNIAHAGQLLEYLVDNAAGQERDEAKQLHRHVAEFQGEGVLLILDGLDETRNASAVRMRLKAVIASFVECFPKSRVIVTSRPYAYQPDSEWSLAVHGFERVELAAFSPLQIEQFCEQWYHGVVERGLIARSQAAHRGQRLWSEISAAAYCMRLAERPLMLTMLADVHTQQDRLPSNRVELYEASTRLLLNRWNEARESHPGESWLSDGLELSVDQVRRAVEALAYRVHRDEHRTYDCVSERGSSGSPGVQFAAGPVIEALRREGGKGKAERLLDFLHQRAGILIEESDDLYRFPHRTVQEFLAACHLTNREFPELLCAEAKQDHERWRDSIVLAIARVGAVPDTAWRLVQRLLGGTADEPESCHPLLVLLCARGLIECGLHKRVEPKYLPLVNLLREKLMNICREGWLLVHDRADVGDALGQLGDPRVASVSWHQVPAGTFWMGAQTSNASAPHYDPQHATSEARPRRVDLPGFELARYPVTVGEYARFVDEGGYTIEEVWDAHGFRVRNARGWTEPAEFNAQRTYPNRPVVGVSFYEAHAYARFVGSRLPSEAEWERAARYPDGRRYPFGSTFDLECCNSASTGLSRVSAVGLFPRGRSALGLDDMSGNVWELCSDNSPPDDPERRGCALACGGSWDCTARQLRGVARRLCSIEARDRQLGFRLARG